MLQWQKEMPQNKGWYLWIDIDWGSSVQDVVIVCCLTDYKEEHRSQLGKDPKKSKSSFLYKNEKGEDLVMCWGEKVPYIDDENEVHVDGWALFDFPDTLLD
jgi:hypothetical protein